MLKRLIPALLMTALLPGTADAKSSQPELLKRSGQWIVDYDKDACHLASEFGAGRDKVIMRVTRYEPGDWFSFNLYGNRLASGEVRGKAKLDFGLSPKPVEAYWMGGKAGEMKAMFFSSVRLDGRETTKSGEKPPSLSPEQETAVTGVTVDIPGKKRFRLDFGSLGRPMAQLRSCQTDLVKSWGYDPEVQATLSRPVKRVNEVTDWLRSGDYPLDAVRQGYNGIVQIRLDVDEAGKVAGCHVLNRTKPDVFADLTCRAVARRAKLEPALDANGQPVRSFSIFQVHWLAR